MDDSRLNNHTEEECSCGCSSEISDDNDEEMVEYETVIITFEDDRESQCAVLDKFNLNEKEYIVLLPLEDNEEELVYIYKYTNDGDDSFSLDVIEDEDELDAVCDMFEKRAEE